MMQALKKENLRDKAADELLRLIVSTRLRPGTTLSSVDLARKMAISRTPVREALQRLEKDGFVVRDGAGVFHVPELSCKEAEDVYGLRAELEPLALRLSGRLDDDRLDKLEAINRRLKTAKGPADLIRQDERWHLCLLAACPNRILLGHIENLHKLSRRYEFAYMGSGARVDPSFRQHGDIVAALRKGDLPSACKRLAENMTVGLPDVLNWLKNAE